jgi:GNAT superfamily N-acetyltransferase
MAPQRMTDNLRGLEEIEFAANVDLYRAAPADVRAARGVEVRSIGGTTCLTCREIDPASMFRRVTGLGLGHTVSQTELDEVLGYMNGLGVQYAIPLAPQAQPPELVSWLAARGFTAGYAWMKFSRPCADPIEAPTDLDIRIVDRELGVEFGRVVAEGFGLPSTIAPWVGALPGRQNWICVMGFADGAAIAAGAVYVSGAYAWLGFGATLPTHRRRGAQSALLARRLREARDRGAQVAVTETGEKLPDKPSNSYRNILRAGFKEAYLRPNYLSPAG